MTRVLLWGNCSHGKLAICVGMRVAAEPLWEASSRFPKFYTWELRISSWTFSTLLGGRLDFTISWANATCECNDWAVWQKWVCPSEYALRCGRVCAWEGVLGGWKASESHEHLPSLLRLMASRTLGAPASREVGGIGTPCKISAVCLLIIFMCIRWHSVLL